jgi:methyl-accepting chemotaxis protein
VSGKRENFRHPLGNFFIKKPLQLRIIAQILVAVLLSAVLTTTFLGYVYTAQSKKGSFYYMSNDVRQDIQLRSLLGIVLPSVVAAQFISIAIALGIGLFSSRRIAVPQYKFEKWVRQLQAGKLNTRLEFRESAEMKDITIQCNEMAETYRVALSDIVKANTAIEDGTTTPQEGTARIKDVLGRFEF